MELCIARSEHGNSRDTAAVCYIHGSAVIGKENGAMTGRCNKFAHAQMACRNNRFIPVFHRGNSLLDQPQL